MKNGAQPSDTVARLVKKQPGSGAGSPPRKLG